MAPHFCWFLKLLFLLLMLALAPCANTRPASAAQPSELIAGNEFLKLFLERDELHSGEYEGARGAMDSAENHQRNAADQTSTPLVGLGSARGAGARSYNYNNNKLNSNNNHKIRNEKRNIQQTDDSKQVVVTSGSKIVFLEEYDDNDAVVDAVARDIDLQKEPKPQEPQRKSQSNDEVKVVAVSVSSSSKRANTQRERERHKFSEKSKPHAPHTSMQSDIMRQQQQKHSSSTTKSSRTGDMSLTTTPATMSPSASNNVDFVNRSHKSEFSIEEAEPLTMSQKQQQQRQAARAPGRTAAMLAMATNADVVDSENSASTNIQNVLAAPLVQSASMRSAVTAPASSVYHGSNRNATSSHVNHQQQVTSHMLDSHDTAHGMPDTSAPASEVDDKLLPFQTVIYHDTKESHGPQSRSISYSSISQNVEDLHAWRHSGILAEAQRNVSESLKPIPRSSMSAKTATGAHQSEPSKFYSVPSKMYSEPAKFYSEPSKVYSEPSKVYGQPEKFYSEPAKVYSQPSKFYSEPAKVYSQPAKVYGEPAKTYWPHGVGEVATETTTTTAAPQTMSSGNAVNAGSSAANSASRRPAIVSRIAFGEAQTTVSASPMDFADESHTTTAPTLNHHTQMQQQMHRQPSRFQSHAAHTHSQLPHTHAQSASQTQEQPQSPSQPRRVLFNLDKLPYDLLNAPVQSAQHLLDPDYTNSPPAAVTYSSPRQRQCLESAFTATRLSQSASQRQHSSMSAEHSNQNAKGLPNRDLVKCVSKYTQPAEPHHITNTESSHIDDLYTPTPEQNYEIEESVSVMTNGRAHGVQGMHGAPTTAPTTMTMTTTPSAIRKPAGGLRGTSRIRFGGETPGNGNLGAGIGAGIGSTSTSTSTGRGGDSSTQRQHHHYYHQQHHYHANANANDDVDGHNYDDGDADGNGDGVGVGADDEHDDGAGKGAADEDDDSKVAYVVEGRNYRKYRVEEKTDDGFIVGEYGVVDHNDGNLRGVRYTADSTINRSLIQKALLTFLKLK